MASVTVRHVLEQIDHFHRQLAELYEELERTAEDARVKLLARCMAAREARLAHSLQRYEHDPANRTTLGCWFKVDPLASDNLRLEGLPFTHDMTSGDLFTIGVTLDARLRDFVQHITEAATSPRVRDLFADLTTQEEAEQRQTARAALEVEREL